MTRKLPRNVCCSISYCSILAAYELCTFGWFSLKFSTLCCRQGSLPTILFLRRSSYMTHLCLQQLATSPSKKTQNTTKKTSTDSSTCPVFLSTLATQMMWKSSKDWQWTATETWLYSFFILLFLISSYPEETVEAYERRYFVNCHINYDAPIICQGPNKNSDLV